MGSSHLFSATDRHLQLGVPCALGMLLLLFVRWTVGLVRNNGELCGICGYHQACLDLCGATTNANHAFDRHRACEIQRHIQRHGVMLCELIIVE